MKQFTITVQDKHYNNLFSEIVTAIDEAAAVERCLGDYNNSIALPQRTGSVWAAHSSEGLLSAQCIEIQ